MPKSLQKYFLLLHLRNAFSSYHTRTLSNQASSVKFCLPCNFLTTFPRTIFEKLRKNYDFLSFLILMVCMRFGIFDYISMCTQVCRSFQRFIIKPAWWNFLECLWNFLVITLWSSLLFVQYRNSNNVPL